MAGKFNQRGGILFTLVFVAMLAMIGLIAAEAAPTYLEYQAVMKAIVKSKDASTVAEIRKTFDKAAQIDDIRSIVGNDLEVTKVGDQNVVSFKYNKEQHLFGPAYLLLKYAGTTATAKK